ncbi:MAG: hypothetical protein KGI60_03720 [Patescibacteria group bacterium]|nr:hypothetical protein [Patescibacteria group bacterium]
MKSIMITAGCAIALSVLLTGPAFAAINQPAQANPTVDSGSTNQTGNVLVFPANPPTGNSQSITLPNPLGNTSTIPDLIGKLVDWLIYIASIAILPAMIVWGAYKFLMAGGDPEKVTEGRHTLTWAVVGYALILLSKSIEIIIQNFLKS